MDKALNVKRLFLNLPLGKYSDLDQNIILEINKDIKTNRKLRKMKIWKSFFRNFSLEIIR